MARIYVTTSIPYVNAPPHIGHALEFVQADTLARHWRRKGIQVRLLSGTDDHAQKNVLAAEAAGIPTQQYVDINASRFETLAQALSLSYDDFIRTSRDPRHRPGVDRLWRACLRSGDLYRATYRGLYCIGCEQFYSDGELEGNVCPDHDLTLEAVEEENWFFRLSRYTGTLRNLIASGELRIQPEGRRREALAFVERGLEDFSVSRPVERTRSWGINVPDDPSQTIYVWWDALGNYITALDFGTGGPAYDHWWRESDRRIHVVGKGILRFHAIYWPAMLLSAGEPLPTDIMVHGYLTADGKKISKSLGNVIDPAELVGRLGADAVRWWLLSAVPKSGDADFTIEDLVKHANEDLADGLGNLVTRTVTMVQRYLVGLVPEVEAQQRMVELEARIGAHLDDFDFRSATAGIMEEIRTCNRQISQSQPWKLASAAADDEKPRNDLAALLGSFVVSERMLAQALATFLPELGARASAQLGSGRSVGLPAPLFPRLSTHLAHEPSGTGSEA